ncbi:MAG: nitroreductase family protein [Acidobacteriota bacterium]
MHPQPEIHELLRKRWSPVAFSSEPIDDATLTALFEAARWSPSCFNAQPWRFYIGRHGTEAHARILSTLTPGNAAWAAHAYILGISVAHDVFAHNGKPNRWAGHDVGVASMSLAIETTARGLFIHFMGGFDQAKAIELLDIPEHHTPMAAFALGHHGDPTPLSPELLAKENKVRTRKPLTDVVTL